MYPMETLLARYFMSAKKTFKALMDSIESITQKLEHDQTDLETSLKLFKEGQGLINEAKARLEELEHEFKVITAHDKTTFDEAGK